MEYTHETVMLREAIELLGIRPGGTYVDCTLGGGGHSSEILRKLRGLGRLISFDQDPAAISAAEPRLAEVGSNYLLINRNFASLGEVLRKECPEGADGILFDLGVSSPQLDQLERGFTYMQDAPLDMRMNPDGNLTAKTIVNTFSEHELAKIIWDYGEERWAKRIAQFIVDKRENKEIASTVELVDIIKAAVPVGARREGSHPAKRTFQALRIAVNDELGVFATALEDGLAALRPGGRMVVISFHSLEDRIAKEKFLEWQGRCTCPADFPVCVCNVESRVKVLTRKPLIPSDRETTSNPRARSAKLRASERK